MRNLLVIIVHCNNGVSIPLNLVNKINTACLIEPAKKGQCITVNCPMQLKPCSAALLNPGIQVRNTATVRPPCQSAVACRRRRTPRTQAQNSTQQTENSMPQTEDTQQEQEQQPATGWWTRDSQLNVSEYYYTTTACARCHCFDIEAEFLISLPGFAPDCFSIYADPGMHDAAPSRIPTTNDSPPRLTIADG